MIRYRCPKCKKALTAHDTEAGAKVACPQCGQHLQIPTPPNQTVLGELIGTQDDPPPANPLPSEGYAGAPPPVRTAALSDAEAVGTKAQGDFPSQDDVDRPLMPCSACGQSVAREAAACPSCGKPNHWTHPQIRRFLRQKHQFESTPHLQAQGKGYVLVGRSTRDKGFTDHVARAVGSVGFFGPATLRGVGKIVAFSVGAGYLSRFLSQVAGPNGQAFTIDFRTTPPAWNSTDDYYWAEVMEFFGLTPPEPPHALERPERNEIDYPPERRDFLKSPAAFFLIFGVVVFLMAVGFCSLVAFTMFHR
jgi:ribosomal protein S27E